MWGWAASGTDVTVSFKGQTKSTKADAQGKWVIKLDPLKASAEAAEMICVFGKKLRQYFCSIPKAKREYSYSFMGVLNMAGITNIQRHIAGT